VRISGGSQLEAKFALMWRALYPDVELVREHKFCESRRWKFDFAHVESKVAVEIEGGIWTGGRHTRGSGYQKDCEKYNAAAAMGWRVFRLCDGMISGANVDLIKAAIFGGVR
jgi:very-short-patch-repair endonuclease